MRNDQKDIKPTQRLKDLKHESTKQLKEDSLGDFLFLGFLSLKIPNRGKIIKSHYKHVIQNLIDENQRVTAEEINNIGIGACLGNIDKILCSDFVGCFFEFLMNDAMKEKMSSRACTFINGEGAKEVVSELIKSYNLAA